MASMLYEDVVMLTGTNLDRQTIDYMIAAADGEISAYITAAGAYMRPEWEPLIRKASEYLIVAKILTRYRLDGRREVSTLEYSDRGDLTGAIDWYTRRAWKILDDILASYKTAFGVRITGFED